MRILYVSLSYLPSRRASSVQVMKMCAALAARGHDVTLLAKQGDEPSARGASLHAYYGVPESFRLERLARPKRRGGGLVYSLAAARRVAKAKDAELIYTRDLAGAAVAAARGAPFVYEAHGVPALRIQRAFLRRFATARSCRGVVSISQALRKDLVDEGLVPASVPHVVEHDACEVGFGRAPRAELGAPPRVGYVGNLYAGRGVELVIELARRMPGVQFDLIGGADADVARVRAAAPPANLTLHGFVAPAQLGQRYAALDVLLMPFPRTGVRALGAMDTSRWCSPMKMFEYMASGVPMIASDLPVLGEVLRDGVNAIIAPAGDVAAWQRALERLLADPALRVGLATRARDDLRRDHTWAGRAERILAGLGLG